ncbi:MAG: hypothetical protein QOH41_2461 [Blastocatellia bacterium]|nr:hypothetical protein [Blastocatellia bacterium]
MKRFLGLVLLILSFSAGHLTYADCSATCRGRSWEVLNYGCEFAELECYGFDHPNCAPTGNTCCYFEQGYNSSCGLFYFKKCFLDSCVV